jgi:uncharacterized membrane protein YkvI
MGNAQDKGQWVRIDRTLDTFGVIKAGVSAIAYGCMNMAISLGVVCQCSRTTPRKICRTSVIFGWILSILFLLCNYVLLQHGELLHASFPIVELLNGMGRGGFLFSAIILYLAVLTTTIAIFCAIRNMGYPHTQNQWIVDGLTVGVPLLLSLIGFGQIVEDLYAPMGLLCLALVFLPALFMRHRKKKNQKPA